MLLGSPSTPYLMVIRGNSSSLTRSFFEQPEERSLVGQTFTIFSRTLVQETETEVRESM